MNTQKINQISPSQELFCKDSVQEDQSQELDILSSKSLYAGQSIQETAAVVFVSTAAEFMPQYEVDVIEVFSWGFRISFLQDIVGGDRLLTVLEEEMRRKLKRSPIESHAMLSSLVPAFLKSRKVNFVGDLPADGVIDFALIDSIAVEICHQDIDDEEVLDTSAVQHFLLFASHNYIEGFVAFDKASFKVLRQRWKEEYSKNESGVLSSSWVSDPVLTEGIPAPTFKLQFAKTRLETICSDEAEKRGYSALFDIALDQLNFQQAAKQKKPLFITTDLKVSQDPVLWDLPVAKAALFLTFLDEVQFEASVQKILKNEVANLLAIFKNLSGMKVSTSLSRGGKSLHKIRNHLFSYLKAGNISEIHELADSVPLSEALFFPGELCLEFSLEDYRMRSAPLGYLRVGRVPAFKEQKGPRGTKLDQGIEGRDDRREGDTLYVAFVPFYGFERIIALMLDHSRGYLPQELAFKNLMVTGKNADEIAKVCLRSGLRSEVMHGKFDRIKEYAAQNGIRFVSAADHNRNDIVNVDHSEVESSTIYVYDISNGQRNLVHTPDELVRLIMASVPAGLSADTGNRAL